MADVPASRGSVTSSYTFGHSQAVLTSHTSRTAQNTAAYLIPFISSSARILDVGCGPGTITCDFAGIAHSGTVVGLDNSESVIEQAHATASQRGLSNVTFLVGDAHALPFEDESFDVVHAHAILTHVPDAVGVLREMRRVCKGDGIVAAKEGAFSTVTFYPELDPLLAWKDVYGRMISAGGGDPEAGPKLCMWGRDVGFEREKIRLGVGAMAYAQREEREWWGESHAKRMVGEGSMGTKVVQRGLVTEREVEEMVRAWRTWKEDDNASWAMMEYEILCWK